jgi:hypothetical protein
VFSRLVWLTQITAFTSDRAAFNILLVAMEAASAKPKSEWSVKTALGAVGGGCSGGWGGGRAKWAMRGQERGREA